MKQIVMKHNEEGYHQIMRIVSCLRKKEHTTLLETQKGCMNASPQTSMVVGMG